MPRKCRDADFVVVACRLCLGQAQLPAAVFFRSSADSPILLYHPFMITIYNATPFCVIAVLSANTAAVTSFKKANWSLSFPSTTFV
ncbi:hypothetical protein BV22DRAFT_459116 [Leucogyrophana mollusca]|uniref:Uncharacterized protein n=1 Tax=Leucogyrophana mollusca TaxID=85980 RepID=A0ACB8BH66_9AGAM|nr:hypothetical protein BV22DRAFT_459116 [Leucogyrophana mollusca]